LTILCAAGVILTPLASFINNLAKIAHFATAILLYGAVFGIIPAYFAQASVHSSFWMAQEKRLGLAR